MDNQLTQLQRYYQPSEIEEALRAIVPSASASPAHLMDAVVQHTIAVGRTVPHRRRRRAVRRHGAYVRLREQQQSRQYNLQLDLMDLQRQVAQLTQLRDMLEARALNAPDAGDGSLVRTAMVYSDIAVYKEVPTTSIDTCAYLATAMHDNVETSRFVGREHFLPLLKWYARYFKDHHLRLTGARILTSPDQAESEVMVRTTGAYGAQLTLATVQELFPHLLFSGGHDTIVQQLLAKPIEGELTFDFTFDRASSRIVRFAPNFNFLPAFLRLVPDPTELAFLFSRAKISEEMVISGFDDPDVDASASPMEAIDVASRGSVSSASDSKRSDQYKSNVSPSRNLKMADLLAPEREEVDESACRPSVFEV